MKQAPVQARVFVILALLLCVSLRISLHAQISIDNAERDRRNALFDDSTGNLPKLDQPQRTDGGYSEFWDRAALPSMPTDVSDAVIVGKVLAARSFLSRDHTRIYTEFSVVPE